MVYGGYGGYGGFGGYGGYGGLGSTPNVASGIYPPGSAYGRDEYMGISHDKPKGFIEGLFTGTWDGIKKMFTTLPGILTTAAAVGLTAATGGAALIPLGALAAGIGIFNAGKGLVNQDGQGFTKGLLLGLGGLLALRFAPREILMGGRTFLLGGSDTATLGLSGRLKALWGGNHFVASNGDKLNWLQMSKDKIMGLFLPNAGSVQHLEELRTKGHQAWKTPQDAKDAFRAGAPCPEGTQNFLKDEKKDAAAIKGLTRKLERQQLAGKPTEEIAEKIKDLQINREARFEAIKKPAAEPELVGASSPAAPVSPPHRPAHSEAGSTDRALSDFDEALSEPDSEIGSIHTAAPAVEHPAARTTPNGNPFAESNSLAAAAPAAAQSGDNNVGSLADWLPQSRSATGGNAASEGWAGPWDEPSHQVARTAGPQAGDRTPQLSRVSSSDALLSPNAESSAPVAQSQPEVSTRQPKSPGLFKRAGKKIRTLFGSAEKLPLTAEPSRAYRFSRFDS